MKAANLAKKLVAHAWKAARVDAATVVVEVAPALLFVDTRVLREQTGWKTVGEYDPETGACRVVLRDVAESG